jgi:hypothetical protein
MAKILISYRREDSSGHAGRLYDRFLERFGRDEVFMDVDTIGPGEDFIDAIERAVTTSEFVIVLIGRQWLTASAADGSRRLDDPKDVVRIEIATALQRGIRVIPVLVQGASMPGTKELPKPLGSLARRNAITISDVRFQRDFRVLLEVLETSGKGAPDKRAAGSRVTSPRIWSILVAAVLMAGAGGLLVHYFSLLESPKPAVVAEPTPARPEEPLGAKRAQEGTIDHLVALKRPAPSPPVGEATIKFAIFGLSASLFPQHGEVIVPGELVYIRASRTFRFPPNLNAARLLETWALSSGQPGVVMDWREESFQVTSTSTGLRTQNRVRIPLDAGEGLYTVEVTDEMIGLDSEKERTSVSFKVRKSP